MSLTISNHEVSDTRMTLLLALAVALGPFTIDTYLPAFPQIAEGIGVDIHAVSLTISVYMFTMAFGQLTGGPVADRYGRKLAMMTGLSIFIVSSLMLAVSDTLYALLFWRAAQAFGGGWSAVTVPAIVRDRCKGKEAAHLFAMIGLIMIIAPAIAPSIGSTILAVSGWRSIFVFLACYGGLVAASLWFGLFAHLPPHSARQTGTVQEKFLNRYITVLKHPLALRLIVIQAMVFSVMLIFLTHASFIYQQWFGLSAFAFSLLFAGNIIVMAAMNTLGRKLLVHYEPAQIVRWAVGLQALAVIMLVLIVLVTPPLYLFAPALMLAVGSLGAVVPNVQASFMHFFEHNSGTASALLGAVPLILTGLISGLSTVLADGTLLPLAGLMLICSVTGLSLAWGVPRRMQIELAKDMAG